VNYIKHLINIYDNVYLVVLVLQVQMSLVFQPPPPSATLSNGGLAPINEHVHSWIVSSICQLINWSVVTHFNHSTNQANKDQDRETNRGIVYSWRIQWKNCRALKIL